MSIHAPSESFLFSIVGGAFLSLMWGVNPVAADEKAAGAITGNAAAPAAVGPTMKLSYSNATFETNPVSSFMYFVPLIAITSVDRQTSAGNSQEVAITSIKRKGNTSSFAVTCEFEVRGAGFHRITFDAPGLIAERVRNVERGSPLVSLLDYIQFEGAGLGAIDVRGTIHDAKETVSEVAFRFNVRGRKSPVTIGIYDLEPRDGRYLYENRSDQSVARVNTITFTRTDSIPTMGVTVASIAKAGAAEGFFSRLKGVVANMVIKPPKIAKLGNQTMLEFGLALARKQPEFAFPIARNIRSDRTVAPEMARP
jgi:hypothetical protein